MNTKDLNPAEERIEEIRAIRRRLFSHVGEDYRKLRELGGRCPEGFELLHGVPTLAPLSDRIAATMSRKRTHGRTRTSPR